MKRGGNLAGPRAQEKAEMVETYPDGAVPYLASDVGRELARGGPREAILLVEDEPAVRQLFAKALSHAGYRVYEARNGEEAVRVFDQHGDAIDLLLTDMRMPYMSGTELAQQLRARRASLKLLCISGYPTGPDNEVAGDFLAKPFSREALLNKVREVLDRR